MMTKTELLAILDRVSNGSATDRDLELYNAWCNAMQEADMEVTDLQSIQAYLLEQIHADAARQKPLIQREWFRIAAAAVFIGLLCTGILIYTKKPPQPRENIARTIPSPTSQNDLAAGGNKATLTLSNGQKLVLSDSLTGNIVRQSGLVISKTAGGQLVYHIHNDPSSAGDSNIGYNTLSTARAEQYQVVLADGTKVWLNAATTLRYPVNFEKLTTRKVELDGEAYFEVVENKAKPFIVHTARQDIQDLGTYFNVNSYADDPSAKTTLLEGSVKINNSMILKPGQQATTTSDGAIKVHYANTRSVMAWKNGYFDFDDENIREIMRKVARWYDAEIIYTGEVSNKTMTGSMSRFENVSKILEILQQTGLFTFRIEQHKIYVSKKENNY